MVPWWFRVKKLHIIVKEALGVRATHKRDCDLVHQVRDQVYQLQVKFFSWRGFCTLKRQLITNPLSTTSLFHLSRRKTETWPPRANLWLTPNRYWARRVVLAWIPVFKGNIIRQLMVEIIISQILLMVLEEHLTQWLRLKDSSMVMPQTWTN